MSPLLGFAAEVKYAANKRLILFALYRKWNMLGWHFPNMLHYTILSLITKI